MVDDSESKYVGTTKMLKTVIGWQRVAAALSILALWGLGASAAQAQGFIKGNKGDLPDASGFYMSRRQYQIIDDGPVVRNSAGQIVPSSQVGFGSNIGGRQAPLKRAGFQSYSSGMPQYSPQNLPRVNNGVPTQPAVAPGGPDSLTAKAMKMGKSGKGKSTKTASSKGGSVAGKPGAKQPVNSVSAYNTYKGYSPVAAGNTPVEQAPAGAAGSAGSGMNSSTNVRGSILHWSRKRSSGQ